MVVIAQCTMMHIANVILISLQDKHDKVEHKRVHSRCENVELEQTPAYVGLSTHTTEPQYEECGGMVISTSSKPEM